MGLNGYFNKSLIAIHASNIAFSSIRNAIICFDDLERKHTNLSITEIFGLASYLREERNCKIIFIFNDETQNTEDKSKFLSYKEKIIDKEILYDDKIENLINYVFEETDEYYDHIKDRCEKLGVNNIR